MPPDENAAIFAAVARERRGIADLLETLDETQLATPSLCAGWDVRTVAAHLAAAASPSVPAFLGAILRAGGRPHRANHQLARQAAERAVPEIAGMLRDRAESRWTPPLAGPCAPLTDVLVHGGDIRVPLGLPHQPPSDAVLPALHYATSGKAVGVIPRSRLAGLRLVAEDSSFAAGSGELIEGPGIDLLLVACGRAAVLPRLRGSGVETLRSRLVP